MATLVLLWSPYGVREHSRDQAQFWGVREHSRDQAQFWGVREHSRDQAQFWGVREHSRDQAQFLGLCTKKWVGVRARSSSHSLFLIVLSCVGTLSLLVKTTRRE